MPRPGGVEVPAHGGVSVVEPGGGHGDEIRIEERVRVLHQDGVVVLELRQHPLQRVVQGAGLLVRVVGGGAGHAHDSRDR
jgi:hypothetical protein